MKALKTIVIFSLFLFVTASHADAQRSLNPNQALYGEVWLITPDQSRGAAGISYERFFSPRKTISIKLGPVPSFSAKIVSFPVMIQGYTSSGRKHHVEFGGGISFLSGYRTDDPGHDEFCCLPGPLSSSLIQYRIRVQLAELQPSEIFPVFR